MINQIESPTWLWAAPTVLALLSTLLVPQASLAQAARALDGADGREALEAHNQARARFGVPPLEWDPGLAEAARACIVENQNRSFRHCDTPYGENMYGSTNAPRPTRAVLAWMEEESTYDVTRSRCRDFECGHFSQVIWDTTRRVGCAVGPGEQGWTNFICNYDPAGNYGYMSDESGERSANGSWFYFDPRPFAGGPTAPMVTPEPGTPETPSANALPEEIPVLWVAPWIRDGDAHRSGRIAHKSESALLATIDGPGTLTFRWRVSSEEGFDVLSFSIDGIQPIEPISGETGWIDVTITVGSGNHDVRWTYTKDLDSSVGEDAGWVDRVRFTGSR